MKRIISAAIVGVLSAVLMISFVSCEPDSGTIADTTINGTTKVTTNIPSTTEQTTTIATTDTDVVTTTPTTTAQ